MWFSRKHKAPERAPPSGSGPAPLNGRYRLGGQLGEGAVSQVVEAGDMRTGATVAVKLISLPPDQSPVQRKEWSTRLRREIALARRLNHPDIVHLLDAGIESGLVWMVMERVRGADLARYTQPQRRLPDNLVVQIGARVAAALAHAHAHGVVHRDLKPANVLVNLAAGQVKLADFGVARVDDAEATRTGMTLGTPAYMAPEQLAGQPATPASDAYALGVMLFELFAGRRPHEAANLGELLRATASQPPAALSALRPDLPPSVTGAVHQLLAHDPADRPGDLAAWAERAAALAAVMTRVLAPSGSASQ
ncbi:MAG: serine/threonine protein kinase [Burkholderiales bacterium PBB5]|nr:MAG: serine/threonine protein kinase [Burkholderiales bacterium PBB5]